MKNTRTQLLISFYSNLILLQLSENVFAIMYILKKPAI